MANITEQVGDIKAAVENKWGKEFANHTLTNLGVYNRRKIANSDTWSQHSWGNAWDIGVKSLTLGNAIVAYLRAEDRSGRLRVGTILWQVPDHYDHIHVEGEPKKTGIPPLTDKDDDYMFAKYLTIDQWGQLHDLGIAKAPTKMELIEYWVTNARLRTETEWGNASANLLVAIAHSKAGLSRGDTVKLG